MTEFKPIDADTPRDKPILVASAVWWTPVNGGTRWEWTTPVVAEFNEERNQWVVGCMRQPTHWAPVPEFPNLPPPDVVKLGEQIDRLEALAVETEDSLNKLHNLQVR